MRALPILLALTEMAAAEAAAPQPQAEKLTRPAAQIQVPPPVAQAPVTAPARAPFSPRRRSPPTPPKPRLLLPLLLEDTWHYLNPDKERSTWESADVKFAADGGLRVTEHTLGADVVVRGSWRAIDDSHITIERPYLPDKARYTLAACKDTADRISVCLFGPNL